MPVECSVEVGAVDQERFHAVDRAVMRHAFDIHNALGRFCDERVYQDELAQRCRAGGLEVHREVLFRAVYRGFAKTYYLDMLVERGIVYELKAAETLNISHQKQLINYFRACRYRGVRSRRRCAKDVRTERWDSVASVRCSTTSEVIRDASCSTSTSHAIGQTPVDQHRPTNRNAHNTDQMILL